MAAAEKNLPDEMQVYFQSEARRLTQEGQDAQTVADALLTVGAANLALVIGKQRTARILALIADRMALSAIQHGEWVSTPGNLN